jgi:acetylornithine deacetylase/succinyl-diaminopimelate desuccinylase-like protein
VDWPAFDRALEARRREILDRFIACLRVDTVSQHPERVRAGAGWLAEAMERRGLEARVLETGGNPNEHIRLDHLYQGVRTTARLLLELGE